MRNETIGKGLILAITFMFFGMNVIPSNGTNVSEKYDISDKKPFINTNIFADTIYVDDDNTQGPWDGTLQYPYQYIQEGINASFDGDTVFVFSGDYDECIIINKALHLEGEDKQTTILSPQKNKNSVKCEVDNITFKGFSIPGFENIFDSSSGIYGTTNNTIISDNIIYNKEGHGIALGNSHNTTIVGNEIRSNSWAIKIAYSTYLSIFNNIIIDNEQGIIYYSQHSNNIDIIDNVFDNNDYWTILLSGPGSNKIINNTILNADMAIYINRLGPTTCNNNEIIGNVIQADTYGIYHDGNYNQIIKNNAFTSCGIYLIGDNELNQFNSHTILDNTANGKPIRYYKNIDDIHVPEDTSQVILANCKNFIIENIITSDIGIGIQLAFSDYNKIIGCIVSSKKYGIELYRSNYNEIHGNKIAVKIAAKTCVFKIEMSDGNIISRNDIKNCIWAGIDLQSSDDNEFIQNNFKRVLKKVRHYNSDSIWLGNYWGRPKLLPKIIRGAKDIAPYGSEIVIQFDWFPAKFPNLIY